MKKRNIKPLNAGSMADIAFLLLIFFLLVTTIEADQGLLRLLPPMAKETTKPIPERNVLEVKINNNNEILLEGDYASTVNVKSMVREFMSNSGIFEENLAAEDLPIRKWILSENVKMEIQTLEARDDLTLKEKSLLKKRNRQLTATELLGDYRELPDNAIIYVSCQNAVTYERYIEIVNEIETSCNELREELCMLKFQRSYKDLDKKLPVDKEIYKAIKRVYPGRVAENLD